MLRHFEEGTKDRKFAHCLVAGIERYPRKLTKKMGDEEKEARMSVKPFVKYVNLQHVMPTRYNLDISEALAATIGDADLTDVKAKEALKSELKAKLQECVRARHRPAHAAPRARATQPARAPASRPRSPPCASPLCPQAVQVVGRGQVGEDGDGRQVLLQEAQVLSGRLNVAAARAPCPSGGVARGARSRVRRAAKL